MTKILTIFCTLFVGLQAFADGPGCPAFDCGAYVCTDYTNGEWTTAASVKVTGAFVFADEPGVNMRLMTTDNGNASGNPKTLIAICTE